MHKINAFVEEFVAAGELLPDSLTSGSVPKG